MVRLGHINGPSWRLKWAETAMGRDGPTPFKSRSKKGRGDQATVFKSKDKKITNQINKANN